MYGHVGSKKRLEILMDKLSGLSLALLLVALAAAPVFAQSGGGGGGGVGASGGTGSAATPSAGSQTAAPPSQTPANRSAAPTSEVPSVGNSPVRSQSDTSTGGTTPNAGATGTAGQAGSVAADPTLGGRISDTSEILDPPGTTGGNARSPATGGIQSMGERSSTPDKGSYGGSVAECVSAWDAASHMTKEAWQQSCERTTR